MNRVSFFYLLLICAILACKNKDENTKNNTAESTAKNNTALSPDSIPKMHIPVLFKDFGEAVRGDTLKTRFKIYNHGLKALDILNYEANCPCIQLSMPKRIIQPGDSSFLDVIYNTETKMGYDEKEIIISGNGYPNRSILRVMCIVKSQRQH